MQLASSGRPGGGLSALAEPPPQTLNALASLAPFNRLAAAEAPPRGLAGLAAARPAASQSIADLLGPAEPAGLDTYERGRPVGDSGGHRLRLYGSVQLAAMLDPKRYPYGNPYRPWFGEGGGGGGGGGSGGGRWLVPQATPPAPAPRPAPGAGAGGTGGAGAGSSTTVPDFVASPRGVIFPVPQGATGPMDTLKRTGFMYTGGSGGWGFHPDTSGLRIMDPVTERRYNYPTGYGVYMNNDGIGFTVNPFTGKTVPHSDPWAHIPK